MALGVEAVFGVMNGVADAGGYDGKWSVTLVWPKSPDGALPFAWEFTANVTDATLHGEFGTAGSPGWMAPDGNIQPNGAANLKAHGSNRHSAHNLKNGARGMPTCIRGPRIRWLGMVAAVGTAPRVSRFTFTG